MGVQEGRNEEGTPDGSTVNGILASEGHERGASGGPGALCPAGQCCRGRGLGRPLSAPPETAGSWGPRLTKVCRVLRAGGCALLVGPCHPQLQVGGKTPASAGFCFKTSLSSALRPPLPVTAASRAPPARGCHLCTHLWLVVQKTSGVGLGQGEVVAARRDDGEGPPGAPAPSTPPRVPGWTGGLSPHWGSGQ